MTKRARTFLGLTFAVMGASWGLCILCCLGLELDMDRYVILRIPFLLGGFSPTIASWVICHREGMSFKEWNRWIFYWKQPWWTYLIVLALAAVYLIPLCLVSGYETGYPWFLVPVMLFPMLVGGGLEEPGWRGVLLPELEKKWSFWVSTLIVAVIWWLWHFPLFLMPGAGQYGESYLAFGVSVLGLTLALSLLREKSGGVFLCVVFHSLINALSGCFIVGDDIQGHALSTALLFLAVLLLQKIWPNKEETP